MEKYGTIPPRFTKAWWEYYWYYYKWHTIAVAFVLMLVVMTLVQCATRTKYDLTVTYAGSAAFAEETISRITDGISEIIDDSDANDEKNVLFQQMNFGTENADPQYEMALQTKLMLEFSAGESYIFIFSKEQLDTYLNQEHVEDLFVPLNEWVNDPAALEGAATGKQGGIDYAVSLGNSAFLKDLGLDMKDQYLVLRAQRNNELDDETLCIQYENAIKACNYLIAQ